MGMAPIRPYCDAVLSKGDTVPLGTVLKNLIGCKWLTVKPGMDRGWAYLLVCRGRLAASQTVWHNGSQQDRARAVGRGG